MKIDTSNPTAEIYGVDEQHTMTVKNTSKLFSMMVDGLYKDKYGAVVRELSANAIDAHVSAGCPEKAFDINVPNHESKFSIRDYGNGLTKDEIVQYFGRLLESSKENDNNAVGAYGIGCKSPFSIVDEFMVVSIKDNIKTTVTFVREDKGIPIFAVTGQEKTNEPSGTKIIIDDRNTDDWIKAIQTQLAAFKIKPNTNIDITYPVIHYMGDLGYVENKHILKHSTYIDMGQVLYPLDKDDFPDVNFVDTNRVIIYKCNIGDIEVPPDRERIELKAKTKKAIPEIVAKQKAELLGHIVEDFKKDFQYNYKWVTNFVDRYRPLISNVSYALYDAIPNTYIDPKLIEGSGQFTVLHYLFNAVISGKATNRQPPMIYKMNDGMAVKYCSVGHKVDSLLSLQLPIYITHDTTVADISARMNQNKHKECIVMRPRVAYIGYFKKIIDECQSFFGAPIHVEMMSKSKPKGPKQPSLNRDWEQKSSTTGIGMYTSKGRTTDVPDDIFDILEKQPFICIRMHNNGYLKDSNYWRHNRLNVVANHSKYPLITLTDRHFDKYSKINPNMMKPTEYVKEKMISDKELIFNAFFSDNEIHRLLAYNFNEPYYEMLRKYRKEYIQYVHNKFGDEQLNSMSIYELSTALRINMHTSLRDVIGNMPIGVEKGRELINKVVGK